jgi:ribose/xylose/arabinose/galactoside ABC-type transport system permease subunit
MAYDQSIYRRRDPDSTDPGTGGPGFGAEPGYGNGSSPRPATAVFRTAGFPVGEFRGSETGETAYRPPASPAALDDVFDDPAHGEPGRDRMGIHAVWEAVLLLAVAAVAFLLYRENPDAVRGRALDSLLVFATGLGLLALAAGLTLRTAAPNLAVGPVSVASALHFAEQGDRGVMNAAGTAAIAAVALGLVLVIFVVGFHVPAWAASLAAAFAVVVFIEQRSAPVSVQGDYDPTRHAIYLFGGFAALALLGGMFGTIKAIRRSVGRFRPIADPARRRGWFAGALTGGAILLSMLFAVVAGVLLAARGNEVAPTSGLEWTGLALGAAFLAGTSAFGRRGGIFGTLFTVVLMTLFITYADERDLDISRYAIAATAIAGGLVVTRLVESFGRPPSAAAGQRLNISNWTPRRSDRQESWSSGLSAQPADDGVEPWGNTHWGAPDR